MKIATWNVNSLRVRMAHLQPWVREHAPDLVCLQETKIVDADFPCDPCKELGYEVIFNGQKTYNGVAILSRTPAQDVEHGMRGYDDAQRRVIAATYDGVRVVNAYVPNGSAVGSDKYQYKLHWLQRFHDYLADALQRYPQLVVVGDFNIAPEDRDVHDPQAWVGSVLVSEDERRAFRALLDLGLVDLFRRFETEAGHFSWWDYRLAAFRRNMGLRIDHILSSAALAPRCTACFIDSAPRRLERPSDHAPVVAEFDLASA